MKGERALTAREGTLVMVAVSVGLLAVDFPAADFAFAFAPTWARFAVPFAVSVAIMVAATVLPSLLLLRQPEPRVVARLVAE